MGKTCHESISRAKNLRQRQTEVEMFLWRKLRGRRFCQFKFRRQHSIGPYIVDFYCSEARLIIELDGGQHLTTQAIIYDERRTVFLKKSAFRVLRFFDNQVFTQTEGVLESIWQHLHNPHVL